MSIFNQMIRGGAGLDAPYPESAAKLAQYKTRTFQETLVDQIAFHERKIKELRAVYDALTPDILAFVEALQKLD